MNMFKPIFCISIMSVSAASLLHAQEAADTVPLQEELEEVVVTATRPVVSSTAEKTTYEAAADPDAKALTLLDILRKVPGVTVDAQDNVMLNGSGDFVVEIDGRPNPAFGQNAGKLFKAMPASVVQRIEVVNSPGARYDAEGVGGVLNIIMKRAGENMDGYSLTATVDAGSNNQGGNIYAMMQKGRVGLTLNVNGSHGAMPAMYIDMLRAQADGMSREFSGKMKNKFDFGHAQLDANIKLTEADRLALSGSWHLYSWKTPYDAVAATSFDGVLSQRYGMLNDNKGHSNSVSAGVDYTHIFGGDRNHKLRVAYQFDTQPSTSTTGAYYYPLAESSDAVLPEDYTSDNDNNMPQHMALAEYSLPIGEHHTIEAGAKMTWRTATSTSLDLDYRHRTTIAAGFASYALSAGDFTAKAGLRYEHTAQKAHFLFGPGEDFKADYSNLVPSVALGWSFAPARSLSATYDMRISRPGIYYLNPYLNAGNPLEVTVGNPYLKPERHNSVALAYTGMHGAFMISSRLSYTFFNDGLTGLMYVRDGVRYTTYANAMHGKNVTLALNATWRIGMKSTLMCGITPSYINKRADNFANHGWMLNVFAGLQQKLPWNLNLGANVFAMTPQVELQGRGVSQFVHMLTLGRSFLKEDRLNVTVSVIDPFYSRMNIKQIEYGDGYMSRTTGHMNLRMVQVSVSLRLGKLNSRVEGRDKIDSDAIDKSSSSSSPMPSVGM